MKASFFLMSIFLLLQTFQSSAQIYGEFKVLKIDSTPNFYLINVKNKKWKGLILTPKNDSLEDKKQCKIELGKRYVLTLLLNSLTRGIPSTASPQIAIDNKVIWKTGDNFMVYFTDDIRRLFYLRQERIIQ
ncbi:hypothetical protein [Flavobacterium panacagri]|uniref:hypothetical protein n=1 Tax=Flavobacterium panacagri TaxID=3034146 RepID=UPI0025A57C36|nr:hypothetical protein [Flavobacterium panacagri]